MLGRHFYFRAIGESDDEGYGDNEALLREAVRDFAERLKGRG